jgi:hypothetical protein
MIYNPKLSIVSAVLLASATFGYVSYASAADAPVAPPPAAQQGETEELDGKVNASSLRPMPQGAAFIVRAWDNSSDTMELAHFIEDQLRLRGNAIGGEGALVLKFSVTETLGQLGSGPQRRLIELDGRAGSGNDDEAQVRLNLFSTDKGGLFNEGRSQAKIPSTQTLEMTLDRPDGQRIWLGEATGKQVPGDRRQTAHQLVGPLIDNIGKTARNQPFAIAAPTAK